MINIPKDHPLVILNQSIPWQDLMEQVIPLLYQEHCISMDIGRRLHLRAHLGAYILQTVHNWTDRWTEEMLKYYVPVVSKRDHQLLSNRRASIEPRIGHLKRRGLGVSRMKTDAGDLISGYRSALSFNLSLMMRDLSNAGVGCR